MVNSIYSDMRYVASELFGEFKQGSVAYVELVPATGGTPDNPGEPTEVVHPINATARPVSTKYVDGSHIVQSDLQISMPNDGVVPSMTGYFTIDGTYSKIIEIMARPAAGVPITWTVVVRR